MSDNNFPPTSRYFATETAQFRAPDGGPLLTYLKRRFLPSLDRFALISEHEVVEGDRLDNLTATHLGDPEQFWRLCDANGAMVPDSLTETVGRRLRITLPEGIPGPKNA